MNKLITLLIIGIWIGLVIGISFLEAPLKFQAPGISLSLGLGIGKLVFGVLNKIEMLFSVLLIIMYAGIFKELNRWHFIAFITLVLIVLIQSIFLLPILDDRADMIISGNTPESTYHHIIYIVAEIIKLFLLFVLFVKSFRLNQGSFSN